VRTLIIAIILAICGVGIVLGGLPDDGDGAYGAGQTAAFLIGFVMLGAAVRFLVKHFSVRAEG
jgi:hypothetical protein